MIGSPPPGTSNPGGNLAIKLSEPKPPVPSANTESEYERFENLASKIVHVSKEEVNEKRGNA
jgi:hypothetical protein